ncbi:hypothetical protein GCM10011365_24760 [Marinicella pacifica]|uniref:Uncharacterized protein n=2 Tax=Marinicella pacifica TaxID=1171543 RepID=A0A917FUI0_9GAMM|nr:hypothetical protein GCM10011365_24760 [Marinicella pacifica]
MTVYKWLSFDDLGGGVFTNITHQYVGQDTNGGDSLVNVHSTNGAVYAIKVESDRNAYGINTGYTLKLH